MDFLEKITQGLKKTRDSLLGQAAAVFQRGRELTEEDYEALEAALLRADVGPSTTEKILEGVRRRLADGAFTGDAREALRAEVEGVLTGSLPPRPEPGSNSPYVILVVGVNGSGKTTTIAKLASRFKEAGDSVLLVACDTFRAAAADQLDVWAARAGVEIVKQKPGSDPAAVAFDGMARAKSRNTRRVLVDTAGRLHVKVNLMEEVKKIRRVIDQQIPGAPHEVLLILDATTGQNGLNQAREFHGALGLTGLVLTKLDGSAKGGVVLAIADTLRLPIRWVGVGEGMEDLVPFDAAGFARALVSS
ncbi:MAG TPA: signal recognition particle-docking protein FtsY [Candidatus Limnocylindrales bacterium]|nr:signal recognition particle-docking protein FtsY [Candidatus Limnocylindrales bacterium]